MRMLIGTMLPTKKNPPTPEPSWTRTATGWRTSRSTPTAAAFKSIPYIGVASVEYAFSAMCICGLCRKYMLTVTQNSGESFGFVIKGNEATASAIANSIIQNM